MIRQPPPDHAPRPVDAQNLLTPGTALLELAELLQGECAHEVQLLLVFALTERARSSGAQPSPKAVRLLRMLSTFASASSYQVFAEVLIKKNGNQADEPPAAEALTVNEYAERRGCSPRRVRQLLAAGKLAGRKSGGVWIVHPDHPFPNTEAP